MVRWYKGNNALMKRFFISNDIQDKNMLQNMIISLETEVRIYKKSIEG